MNSNAPTQVHPAASSGAPANESQDGLAELRREFASLKDHVARFASQAGGEAAKSIRGVRESVAAQVGDAASGVTETGADLMSSATEQAKTFAAELEGMARRNPLGTIAGAVLVGVVIGMMSRGRG
ncbi:MAG: hypothetical protein WDO17_16240 [Alphaproteobacteria bacterium]